MKQFAFPFSVYCKDETEYTETFEILGELGYTYYEQCGRRAFIKSHASIMTCFRGVQNYFENDYEISNYDYNRHHIPHFDAALVRDIAAACTNDTWQKGELYKHEKTLYVIDGLAGESVAKWDVTRPTLAEICSHHGYEIKGKDIVKIEPKHNDLPTIKELQERCINMWNDELNKFMNKARPVLDKAYRIKELEAENATLKAKLSKILHVINNP